MNRPHLELARSYWAEAMISGGIAIDATCGNGQDTLKICQLALNNPEGHVYGLDIQPEALDTTRLLLSQNLSEEKMRRISLLQQCHSSFPVTLKPQSVRLIVYNLGYLPRGNKTLTTQTSTTLESLAKGLQLIQPGGMISLMCYPGHDEGAREEEALLKAVEPLSRSEWTCSHHRWINRQRAPSLLLLQLNK